MKIAVFSDPHLGYARFEEDSYVQAERAIASASEKADLILCAGDIFDTKIPKLETLKRAIEMFAKTVVPVYVIHGNHERRAKDMVNPVQLLSAGTKVRLLHDEAAVFEKNGEKVQVFGMGSMPEEHAETALKGMMGGFSREDGAFSILMLHQSIRELIPGGEDELTLKYLESLPFDLIVNGHIHETVSKLGGRFIIPGSTVITQLKKDEMAEKGYFLYDTKTKRSEFVKIQSRPFFYEELEFKGAGESEIRERIRERVKEIRAKHPDSVIAVKIDGTLKEGLSGSDIKVDGYEHVFIENRLNVGTLTAKLERIRSSRETNLSLREAAVKELKAKTDGKIDRFDSTELFEKLVIGPDETLEYLEKRKKGSETAG